MGLRVQATTTTKNVSSMNVSRIAALDKWKTDWFHEISNIFMVTTDQVVCSNNDANSTKSDESGPTSKYHSRMLQNRAKLNMVVSMVERYMKGNLSVERASQNQVNKCDRATNITPWTMVSPDEVCPVDYIHQNRKNDETTHKKRFTVDEALDKLTENHVEDHVPDVHETPMNIDDDLMTALQRERTEKQEKMPDDLLAQACELLNSTKNCEPNITNVQDIIENFGQKLNDTPVICPPTNTRTETDNSLCQTSPAQVDQDTLATMKNVTNSQSLTSNGKYMVLSSNGNDNLNGHLRPISIQPDNRQKAMSKQPKLVEIVPATLPDGRVIHLEIVRQPSPALQSTLANSAGVKHVILPRNLNGKVMNKSMGKLLPLPKSLVTNTASKPSSTAKQTPYVFTSGNVPMVCLKRPTAEFSSGSITNQANKTYELAPATPDFLRRLQQSGAQVVFQKSTHQNSVAVTNSQNNVTQLPLSRKRTYNGETKIENAITAKSLENTENITNNDIGRHSPTESIINNAEIPNADGEDLNVNLLNELMEQLPSPQKDDDGSSDDLFEDILREASENNFTVPPTSIQNTTAVKLNTGKSQIVYPNTDLKKYRQPLHKLVSSVNEITVLQNVENKRKRAISSDVNKRKALSSLDVNARPKTISCDENTLMPKPKRKYTKRVEVLEENGSTTMLGPTAAAAARNPFQKPPLSYNILIYLAFKESGFVCLTVKQIYSFILKTFPYFSQAHQTWQNAIRHQLCCCKVYEKVPIVEVENGIEKTTSRSAWKVLNNKCIVKLEEDTASSLTKKNALEKIRTSLCDQDQFEPLFGEVMSKLKEKGCFVYETEAKVVTTNVRYSRDQKLVSKCVTNEEQSVGESTVLSPLMSSGSSTIDDDEVTTNEDFSYFGNFDDHIDPLFFDISSKTMDVSSIYNF